MSLEGFGTRVIFPFCLSKRLELSGAPSDHTKRMTLQTNIHFHSLFLLQRTSRRFGDILLYTVTILLSGRADLVTGHHYHVEDVSLLQVFDQPLHGLLESAFLRSLYRRLALYMGV